MIRSARRRRRRSTAILLLLNTVLLSLPATAAACASRPRSPAAWLAAVIVFLFGGIVVLSETIGRLSYAPGSMTIASAVLGTAGAAWLWRRRASERSARRRWSIGRRVRVAVSSWPARGALVVWVVVVVYSLVAVVMLPPIVNDVLKYHLPPLVAWMQAGVIHVVPELDYRSSFFPHNVELLNGWCLLLAGGDRLICLPQLVISGILWPVVVALALRACGIRRSWCLFGAVLASVNAPVVLHMRNEMVDVGFAAPLVLALLLAIDGHRLYRRPLLVLAAATGFAVGVKASGPAAAILVGAVWGVSTLRRAGWRPGLLLRPRALGAAATWCVVTILVGGGVFIQNIVAFDNPVYPFALKVGPLVLPAADTSHMFPYLGDFGASPLMSLARGVIRWPRLLLGLDPFDRYWTAGSGGFGPLVPAMLVVLAVLAIAAILRPRGGRRRRRIPGFAIVLAVGLLLWNTILLGFVDLTLAAPCDARYQLHLVPLIVLPLVALTSRFGRRWRLVIGLALVVVMAWSAGVMIHRALQRGWRVQLRWVISGRQPRRFVYTGRPIFIFGDEDRFDDAVPDDATILLVGRFPYPLYGRNLSRRVIFASALGPFMGTVKLPDVPDDVLEACRRDIEEYYAQVAAGAPPVISGVTPAAVRLFDHVAADSGVSHLYCGLGRTATLDESPNWTLLHAEDNPRAPESARRRFHNASMALYEYVGPRAADGRGPAP